MKAIINGRFIIPDESGRFTIEEGLTLFFDEKIQRIRPAATISEDEREGLEECIDAPDDGDGAVAVVAELLQSLAEGAVLIEVGNAALWREKVRDIHGMTVPSKRR